MKQYINKCSERKYVENDIHKCYKYLTQPDDGETIAMNKKTESRICAIQMRIYSRKVRIS